MRPTAYDDILSQQAKLSEIITKCASENRAPSADEQSQLTTIKSDIDAIRSAWETRGRTAFLESLAGERGRSDGQPLTLKSADSFAKHLEGTYAPELKEASLGKILRGYITGNWDGAELEQKAMGSTPLSSGGIMIPTPVAGTVIDLARAQARLLQAGAVTVPMSTATLRYARLTQDPTPGWTPEATDIPVSQAAMDSVTFNARKLAVIVPVDNELIEDAPNVDGVIENSIARAIALGLDNAGMFGTGVAPQPQGLHGACLQWPLAKAGLPTYDNFINIVSTLRGSNFEPNAIIGSPATYFNLDTAKTTTNEYITPPQVFQNLTRLSTSQLPRVVAAEGVAGAGITHAFTGQWNQFALGLRSSLQIEISREGSYFDTTLPTPAYQNAFSKDQTLIRAILRADWQLLHPSAIYELTAPTS